MNVKSVIINQNIAVVSGIMLKLYMKVLSTNVRNVIIQPNPNFPFENTRRLYTKGSFTILSSSYSESVLIVGI